MDAENLSFITTEPAVNYFLLLCVDDGKRKLSWVKFRELANHEWRKRGDRK